MPKSFSKLSLRSRADMGLALEHRYPCPDNSMTTVYRTTVASTLPTARPGSYHTLTLSPSKACKDCIPVPNMPRCEGVYAGVHKVCVNPAHSKTKLVLHIDSLPLQSMQGSYSDAKPAKM
mmetsp:Transcript_29073/g.75222  ORF Transcript_29073/g.75222 Transcript_29073/m.75222 type:complete len:120 (+) Transcript_29073:350-709(+)